ncbi:MAG: NAD+ synthase [Actinobacteria bacterium]|nr:NAD+ synthase [Actinomycetota bacterium]
MPKVDKRAVLRLASAQINPVVGDIKGNIDLVIGAIKDAHEKGAQVVLLPEMVVTGYPVEDLALRPAFRRASIDAVDALAKNLQKQGLGAVLVVLGFLDDDGRPLNSVAILHGGLVKARYVKRHLPNYGVFDEFRNFVAGEGTLLVELAARNPGLVLVPNGSPYERSKDDLRFELVRKRATQIGAPIVYTNMFGGQDDLVFDGDSMVVSDSGELLARSPQFKEDLLVIDLELASATGSPDLVISENSIAPIGEVKSAIAGPLSETEEIYSALVLGLRDYVLKNGFKSVVLGLSGGIDSALVATIAVDALGKERVFGVSLPSKYSSDHSKSDAAQLAKNLGIDFRTIEIESVVQGFLSATTLTGLAEENIQARVRGSLLMGLSNQEGHLVLATGNKSELAVGYSTLYGDAVGGFAPIKDVFKVDVWRLAKWRNESAKAGGEIPPIPVNSIEKEPSAELRPGQKDSDSIPAYNELDKILELYIDKGGDAGAIISGGYDRALVERIIGLVDRAEYKRRQYPPGPKVTPIAFGKDRRLPMTSRWNESNSSS